MGRGWRKAFCATIPTAHIQNDDDSTITSSPSPKTCAKLGFLSSISNPSTPRLHIRTSIPDHSKSTSNNPRLKLGSNPSSPRSPFAILKNSLRLTKSRCGLCLHTLNSRTTPVYTAECSHSFHFPCISSHVRSQSCLVCPVCNLNWNNVPLLSFDSPSTPTDTTRSKRILYYNDDEPLLSTRKSDKLPFQKPRPLSVDVKLLPEAAVVSGNRIYQTYAIALRIKAPPSTESSTHRAPMDLVAVLDVSGSMIGSKLQMLKRAMRLIISSLGSDDRLSILAFASTSDRLLPLTRMTLQGQKAARKIIDQLACGKGSCVSEALRKASKVLEDRRQKNPVCSIILLSDAQDEYPCGGGGGNTNKCVGGFAHIEIPVNPSGFGGVGGLLSVVVQDLRVQLGFASASGSTAEIMAVYSCNGRPSLMSTDSARLGDLYAEEERELLVELKVPTAAIKAHHVMCVRCSYKDPVTGEVMYGRERALLVPIPQAMMSSNTPRLKNIFIYTRAVAESRRLVDHGDYSSAHHLISSARSLVAQSDSAEEYARGLEAELAHVHWRRQYQLEMEQKGFLEDDEAVTPKSAWGAAERLAKVAMIKKSLNKCVSELHGFENARF